MFDFIHLDAAENVFFERQLEQVRQRTYDVKYPELKARLLIPVDNSVDPGAETVKYDQLDRVGLAKVISSYADDLPRSDVKAKEFRQAIKSLGAAFGYSIQDVRAARFAGKPLDARKASAARRAMEEALDIIGAAGDSANGLQGLLAVTNANTYTVPAGDSGLATWADKTADEILADLEGLFITSIDLTNGIEKINTIVMPEVQYGLIASKPRATGTDTTVLDFFLRTHPGVQVEPWYKCKGAGSGATDRMVGYRRDPDALQLVIPQEFEQFPPEQENLAFKIACHMRTGGVVVYYPMSITYGDGI